MTTKKNKGIETQAITLREKQWDEMKKATVNIIVDLIAIRDELYTRQGLPPGKKWRLKDGSWKVAKNRAKA